MQKVIFVDAHVHMYPRYNVLSAFQHGFLNMRNASGKFISGSQNDTAAYVWLLAERHDCDFFHTIMRDMSINNDILKIEPAGDQKTLVAMVRGQEPLYVVAGRQIVSRERLEVLSLASDVRIENGQKTAADIIKHTIDAGGVPVLNWAPGKWFFARGKIVENIIEHTSSAHYFLGDTPLRNTLWPMPRLMKKAQQQGVKILAGSDPLPFGGEEQHIGSYGFHLRGELDTDRPAESIRTLLVDRETHVSLFGRRNSPFTFILRQSRIMAAKK
jgi:hypothetical protein